MSRLNPQRCAVTVALVVAAACAHTNVSSLTAPDAVRLQFRRIMVSVPLTDLEVRRAAEDQFVSTYHGTGVQFIPSYRVLFPGNSYTPDEAQAEIVRDSIDGALFISLNNAGSSAYRTPTNTSTACTATSYYGQCSSTTTGGYDIHKPWASFTANLFDTRTGQSVWVASERTGGNAYANARTLVRSMARATVQKMEKDGVIPKG